ncbi:MAG: hemolysin family protein [Rickettsiales bacterium]|nr:hemolysin family protein [Rickettsiales bacterium]
MNQSEELSRLPAETETDGRPTGLFGWMRLFFSSRADNTLKEALEEIIQEHEDDGHVFTAEEKDMLRNVLEVRDSTVSDVMVPRADILAVDCHISLEALKKFFILNGHTRLPVFDQTLDRLRGFIHLKDVLPSIAGEKPFIMEELLRNILFISPTMKVVDLLMQMRLSGVHMAIVVDEYGGTDGLVTMEDLFEELIGEIQDEHDLPEPEEELKMLSARAYEADARIRIDQIEGKLGVTLRPEDEEEEYDTLGGLIFEKLGRVPVRGEIVMLEGVARLDILDADPRRVRRVRLTLMKDHRAAEQVDVPKR